MASANVTQTVAQTAVDGFLTRNATESFFLSKTQKYAVFSCDTENVEAKTLVAGTALKFDIPRHGDLIRGVTLKITGPGLENKAATSNKIIVPGTAQLGASHASTHAENSYAAAGDGNVVKTPSSGNVESVNSPNDCAARYCDFFGAQVVDNTRWLAGGQEVDRITGNHIQIYFSAFSHLVPKRSLNHGSKYERGQMALRETCVWYIPLPFYFCNNQNAWNLLATNFSSLQLEVTCVSPLTCIENRSTNMSTFTLETSGSADAISTYKFGTEVAPAVADYSVAVLLSYVYIGQDERNARLSEQRDQLILQHQEAKSIAQFTSATTLNNREINFNFPVACQTLLPVWSARADNGEKGCFMGAVNRKRVSAEHPEGMPDHLISSLTLKFNNNTRQQAEDGHYYSELQPYMHGERIPEHNHLYMYSYGLYSPYSGNPSGSANYSRIDRVTADIACAWTSGTVDVHAYATSYNVVHFANGTCTLRFAS